MKKSEVTQRDTAAEQNLMCRDLGMSLVVGLPQRRASRSGLVVAPVLVSAPRVRCRFTMRGLLVNIPQTSTQPHFFRRLRQAKYVVGGFGLVIVLWMILSPLGSGRMTAMR